MLTDKQIRDMRVMYFEKDTPVEQIAAKRNCCVATVYKYLKPEHETVIEKKNKTPVGKLTPFEEIIRGGLLKINNVSINNDIPPGEFMIDSLKSTLLLMRAMVRYYVHIKG